MPIDLERLEKMLAQMRASKYEEVGVAVALQQVVDSVQALFDVTGTGLMFIDDGQALRYVAASDEAGRVLEVAQEEHGVGPCVDALIHDAVVRVEDITSDARYQAIASVVAARGVRAVLGVPVHIGGSAVGSLDAYSHKPTRWDDDDVDALTKFVHVIETIIGTALLTERQSNVVEQLEFALENRVTIERAVGVLMARHNVEPVGAFNLLRNQARSQRRKVAALAQDVLDEFASPPDA
jgi:GAF domain-containing protein